MTTMAKKRLVCTDVQQRPYAMTYEKYDVTWPLSSNEVGRLLMHYQVQEGSTPGRLLLDNAQMDQLGRTIVLPCTPGPGPAFTYDRTY
jgi:hypothetical protein